jgi:PAS domain S-box-containing protein
MAGEWPLGLVFDALPVAMMVVSQAARVVRANAAAEDLFGYGRRELDGVALEELSAFGLSEGEPHPWLADPLRGALTSRAAEADHRLKARRHDGSVFPLEAGLAHIELRGDRAFVLSMLDLSARKATEGRLLNLSLELAQRTTDLENQTFALQSEIEQREKVEAELRSWHEDFQFLFQRNPLPMWLYSPETLHFLQVNEAALERYGYTRSEFLAMTVPGLLATDQLDRMEEVVEQAHEKDFLKSHNWKHRDKQGKVIEVDVFSRSLRTDGIGSQLVVAVDVTERNAAEAQLRQAQKMEAIGQLTGGVAHDFNNLLTIILGNLELIAEACLNKPEVRAMADDALAAVHRGADLTQRLLAFSRQQPLEPRVVDIPHLINDLAGLMRRSLGESIRVEVALSPELWKTRVDPSLLENALLNLAVNARDAMPEGGRLTFEAQNTVLDADYAEENAEVMAGEYVQIAVSDSGTGITPEVMEHILEPFFTTKAVGKGTGLGLSMVYGFIKQSGGHIQVYSEVGYGTTVKLYLPRTVGASVAEEHLSLSGSLPRALRGETILLVEDDATIRKLVARLLGTLGYKVLEAGDGATALEVLRTASPLDLLFTDIVLPNGLSGATLAAEAQARYPGLKVLYMSGYTRNALRHNQASDDSGYLLSKPFRKEELARSLHRALHG